MRRADNDGVRKEGRVGWLAAAQAVGDVASGIEANQARQRNKGIIGQAYKLGQQRLNLTQQDTRQSQGENLGARGLSGGGDVYTGGAVSPTSTSTGGAGAAPVSVGGAHTLGEQATADESREQQLEQTGLAQQAAQAYTANNANADTSELESGIAAGGSAAAAFTQPQQQQQLTTPAAAGVASSGVPAPSPVGPTTSPYGNSWGGIDPIHPLSRGTWSGDPTSTGGFNVFNPNANQ